eukprot:TRINITY_DN3991_c0_g1_i2.p1 TRINITY_DN3991_c0_g1~~TRINITY_DN3991_c0_g1_i2.p1  ORF type:complete len:261 (-),score=69.65 TRINITY_DN3991_c0_g1_i2:78-860(-)
MSLFELKTFFLLGNYQQAINMAGNVSVENDAERLEKDILVYRCYVEQGEYGIVLDEINGQAPLPLLVVKVLASFLSNPNTHEKVFATLAQWVESGETSKHPQLQLLVALIYFKANRLEEALRVIHNTNNLEGRALIIQLFLSLNRLDLASKELSRMQQQQDDAIATRLAHAWVCVFQGGEKKCEEAVETYQELIERYGASSLLLNGLGVAYMAQGNFEMAEKVLMDGLLSDNKMSACRINLYVVSQHLNRPQDKLKRDLR